MFRKRFAFVALIAAVALVAAACADDDDAEAPIKACQITDVGGIDDRTFNETAWNGMVMARDQLGAEVSFLESVDATDYRPNIDSSIAEGCDLVLTVGFLLADDTGAAAADNPDQLFAIIDFPVYDGPPWLDAAGNTVTNVRGLTYATDQAAFLAGYLSAGMSQTGVLGTFGGINIPPVTVFMDGFVLGARHYDSVHGTSTTVLGWDPEAQEGLFTGNFESLEDGRAFAQSLMDEGADVILPVAGPVGLGSAAAIQEANAAGASVMMIGVDTDMVISAPEFRDILLTSILKNMDVSVFDTIQTILDTGTIGEQYLGTLENDGVGLSEFHDFDALVPDSLKQELEDLRQAIIAGQIPTSP